MHTLQNKVFGRRKLEAYCGNPYFHYMFSKTCWIEHLLWMNTFLLWTVCGRTLDFAIQMRLLWIDTPNLEHWTFFFKIFSKFPCELHPKIEWHPNPKIVHLLHSAMACGQMEQTKYISVVCVCVCVCVCVWALLLNNDRKKEIRCEDLGTKVDALQDLSNDMVMWGMEKSKTMTFHDFLQKKQYKIISWVSLLDWAPAYIEQYDQYPRVFNVAMFHYTCICFRNHLWLLLGCGMLGLIEFHHHPIFLKYWRLDLWCILL